MIRDQFHETILGTPPAGWTLGYVTIHLAPDLSDQRKNATIEAWRRGAFAVHAVANPDGGRLSHAPTGLRIWTAETLDDAVELAEELEPITNWQAITKMEPPGGKLYPKVRRVIDRLFGEDAEEPTP